MLYLQVWFYHHTSGTGRATSSNCDGIYVCCLCVHVLYLQVWFYHHTSGTGRAASSNCDGISVCCLCVCMCYIYRFGFIVIPRVQEEPPLPTDVPSLWSIYTCGPACRLCTYQYPGTWTWLTGWDRATAGPVFFHQDGIRV